VVSWHHQAVTAPRTVPPATAATPPPSRPAPTHACVRCGAPVPIDVGLCERCNPLGLRDSASSQVHGIAVAGILAFIVILAVAGRFAISGIGPFQASATSVADGAGLAVTLTVTNQGTSVGQTTCRVSDPADRTGNLGGFVLSPKVEPGATVTFTQHMTELGNTVRPLVADCSAP
jgi:ribosomal protein L40E